jgi:UDP-N-acetylmuramoylalanine--D-glutamate ligase
VEIGWKKRLPASRKGRLREAIQPTGDWSGKAVTVMGLGLFGGGLGAAAFALDKGARVTVTDLRGPDVLAAALKSLRELPGAESIELVLGEHRDADFAEADIVVANPAVPPTARHLGVARRGGARVTSAIELLLGELTCRVVAITGTHGKSSTVHFTAALLRASLGPGVRVVLGGNIGGSLLGEIESLGPRDVVVLELSSYQLENLSAEFVAAASRHRAVDVAAITTIGVDHLARHGSVEVYRAAKLRIAQLTGQTGSDAGEVIAEAAEENALRQLLPETTKLTLIDGDVPPAEASVLAQLQVPGDFQRKNLRAALAVARSLGAIEAQLERAVPALTGLPHRMERLTQWTMTPGGRPLAVYDNGVSTTPESTVAALESVSDGASARDLRLVLVGGQAKRGCDMEALGKTAAALGWVLVPFGAASEELAAMAAAAGATVADGDQDRDGGCSGVEEAVERALRWVSEGPGSRRGYSAGPQASQGEGDSVHLLFSPACASFDRYSNFEERALAFQSALATCLKQAQSG